MDKPSFVYVTYIASTPEKVWQALTDADITARYWGHSNVSDWRVDARWEHRRGDPSGAIDIVGRVVESAPPHRLVITWADPADADNPDKVSRVTFDIAGHKDGSVKLTVTHAELEPASPMLRGISAGWPFVLSALKTYLETGRTLPR